MVHLHASQRDVSLAARIEDVLRSVDGIHGCLEATDYWHAHVWFDDHLLEPRTRVIVDALGMYDYSNIPLRIVIRRDAPAPELVFLHELGHYLDHVHLDIEFNRSFASRGDLLALSHWRGAALDSLLAMRIREYIDNPPPGTSAAHLGLLSSFLTPIELWACSYSQFVAQQIGLEAQLDRYRHAYVVACRHWLTDDFEAISAAVRHVMYMRGWLQ